MEAHWGTQIKCANKNTRIYTKNSNRKKNYRAARKFTISHGPEFLANDTVRKTNQ